MADSGTDKLRPRLRVEPVVVDQDAVYEIEEALKRIEKKTYGVCELTGKNIPGHASKRSRGHGSRSKRRRN